MSNWDDVKQKEHDAFFELEEAEKKPQDKPGGSNAGKYKGVKSFCGPSGGAPSGTFPVNTKKRAIAALAYARNAPNPSGIRECVYRHYPDLRPKETKVKQYYVDCQKPSYWQHD